MADRIVEVTEQLKRARIEAARETELMQKHAETLRAKRVPSLPYVVPVEEQEPAGPSRATLGAAEVQAQYMLIENVNLTSASMLKDIFMPAVHARRDALLARGEVMVRYHHASDADRPALMAQVKAFDVVVTEQQAIMDKYENEQVPALDQMRRDIYAANRAQIRESQRGVNLLLEAAEQ